VSWVPGLFWNAMPARWPVDPDARDADRRLAGVGLEPGDQLLEILGSQPLLADITSGSLAIRTIGSRSLIRSNCSA